MAVFTTMFESMMIKMMKRIAKDYSIDLDEMKKRYLEVPTGDDDDQEDTVVKPVVKPKKSKGPRTKASEIEKEAKGNSPPLSKMKKADLIKRCNELSLDEDGTVAVLKARIKEFLEKPQKEPEEPQEEEVPKKRKLPKNFGKKPEPKIDRAWKCMMSDSYGSTMVCKIGGHEAIEVDQEDGVCVATHISFEEIELSDGEVFTKDIREPLVDDKGTDAIYEHLKMFSDEDFGEIVVTCDGIKKEFRF